MPPLNVVPFTLPYSEDEKSNICALHHTYWAVSSGFDSYLSYRRPIWFDPHIINIAPTLCTINIYLKLWFSESFALNNLIGVIVQSISTKSKRFMKFESPVNAGFVSALYFLSVYWCIRLCLLIPTSVALRDMETI